MSILLRIVGTIWILLTVKEVWFLSQRFLNRGLSAPLGLQDILHLLMMAGGVGLLLLREWGRWIVLLGASALLILQVGPSLLRLRIDPLLIRHIIFYGIFIALLLIPQARAATRK